MTKNMIKGELTAGLLVFIIAVPLSLGISMASGVAPAAGIISAIIGGIIVGFFSGAPLAVSGPAAGLSAIVLGLVNQHGLENIGIITVMAGAFQLVFALLRSGKIFNYFPQSVLYGMLSAIGFIIVAGQVHVLFGESVPKSTATALVLLWDRVSSLLNPSVLIIFMLGFFALLFQVYWPKFFAKLKWLPAALPAVIVVTLLSLFFDMPRVTLAPMGDVVQSSFNYILSGSWSTLTFALAQSAFVLAVIASAESLLTAKAIDQMAHEVKVPHQLKLNKELGAQGLGNLVAGFLGGIPVTAVMVRSAANVQAGGRSRLSTIFHGVFIALFVLLLPFVLESIPLTALAAVLIITGFKLLNYKKCLELFQKKSPEGIIWVITFAAIVFTNLLTGLFVGLMTALLLKMIYKSKMVKA